MQSRHQHTMFGALMLAAGMGLDGLWIHAKAVLVQLLLARAGVRSDHRRDARRPWLWADMAPIARLGVLRLLQNLIVLDDDSGHARAFGTNLNTISHESSASAGTNARAPGQTL